MVGEQIAGATSQYHKTEQEKNKCPKDSAAHRLGPGLQGPTQPLP